MWVVIALVGEYTCKRTRMAYTDAVQPVDNLRAEHFDQRPLRLMECR